jgi:polar amino acid transport system substrate-binding protein
MQPLAKAFAPALVLLLMMGCSPPAEHVPSEPADATAEATGPDPAGRPEQAPGEPCSLVMGWDPWPPFHFIDHAGELTGFDIEIVEALAAEAGCELSFRRDSWAHLLAGIRSGEIHLVTGATMTPEREQYALFSAPLRYEEFALFVRAGEGARWLAGDFRSIMDAGMRLGVTEAYDYGTVLNQVLDEPAYGENIKRARFGDANLARLLELEIDGFLEDRLAAQAMIRRLGLEEEIRPLPLAMAGSSEVRIMFSRETVPVELVERFDAGLEAIRARGQYASIESRYFE